MELDKAKASLASYKGHFTRQKRAFDTRLAVFKNQPGVSENWKVLDSAFQKYSKGYEQLEAAFVAVQVLDADPAYEAQANESFNFFEEATSEFSKAAEVRVREQRKSGDDGGGSGGAPKKVAKSVDSLKPDVLTKSMKPTEFRNWRRRFMDWYTTSCFEVLPVEGQTAFLRSVMEVELIDQVDFGGVTTIKVALDRVEAQFMLIHPLLNRRVQFLTMQQAEGQLMSEHIIGLTKAGMEADVDTMTPEDWKATRIISSCTDKEMRTKLLEMKPAVANKPTVTELEKVVADFEARKISEDLLTGGGPKNRRIQKEKDKGKCWKCQQKGHFARECTFPKDKLYCKVCNTKGNHNTFEGCQGKKEYPQKEKKPKKKEKSRRSVTPGPDGTGSATDTENEDSSPEHENHNRRMVGRVTDQSEGCESLSDEVAHVEI